MKRKADKADMDPSEYLEMYFRERNMQGEAQCALADDIKTRAEGARENYKRIRLEGRHGEENTSSLTPQQKYDRRLENNRSSAAACRVYKEVLRKETDFTLRDVSLRAKKYEQEVARLQADDERRKAEMEQMRVKIVRLEAQVAQGAAAAAAGSPNKVEDAPAAFENFLNLDGALSLPEARNDAALMLPASQNPFPAKYGASHGELAHVRYGDSLPRTESHATERERSDEVRRSLGAPSNALSALRPASITLSVGSGSQSVHRCSQDLLKMATPETEDDDLPTLLSQNATIK